MNNIRTYKDLLIWQKGIILVVKVYKLVKDFPKEELYSLANQIKRTSVSVPSNISEGYGRNTDKSFSHFLDIARGSLYELETQIIISRELEFITNFELYDEILSIITEESKMINAFSKTLQPKN